MCILENESYKIAQNIEQTVKMERKIKRHECRKVTTQ